MFIFVQVSVRISVLTVRMPVPTLTNWNDISEFTRAKNRTNATSATCDSLRVTASRWAALPVLA